MTPPEIIAIGRCNYCDTHHPSRTPRFLANVNLGPGDAVAIYWHDRRGATAAAKSGSTQRHTATAFGKKPDKCPGCGRPVRVSERRLIEEARAAALTAVDGRCQFVIDIR